MDITVGELEGRNQRSALFKTMFLAFRAAGAKDWNSKLSISLGHEGTSHRLQFHHIFPKAVLRSAYAPRDADDIANLCFISGKTNRQISDREPSQYLPLMIEKSGITAFENQCIPTAQRLLNKEVYSEFLSSRRELIVKRLNEFLAR